MERSTLNQQQARDTEAERASDAERFRTEFMNELLSQIPEEWDADEAAEAIAIDYVRHLEAEVKRLGGSFYPWAEDAPPAPTMRDELRAWREACRSQLTPDVSRLDWLSSLLAGIEDGTFAKDAEEDPDAMWTVIRESRELLTALRAVAASTGGETP